jgi:hypothetical protein
MTPDFEEAARRAGWKRSPPDSQFSWEKQPTPNSVRGHWKADLITAEPLKMSAQELCEQENIKPEECKL